MALCACLLPWIPNLLVQKYIKTHRPTIHTMLSHDFVSTLQSTLKLNYFHYVTK